MTHSPAPAPAVPAEPISEIEQAIRELMSASHDVGLFCSDKYIAFEARMKHDLLAAIAAALAQRERETIERCDAIADDEAERNADQPGYVTAARIGMRLRALLPEEKTP